MLMGVDPTAELRVKAWWSIEGRRLAADDELVVGSGTADHQVEALRGLDLDVDEGIFLGVMGQSGSGKSTHLSILGGLCHPTAGTVRVDGIDL